MVVYLLVHEDDVLLEVLHRLVGSLWNTADYRPLHSQECVRRFFETLGNLVLVVSDHLRL